MTIYLISGVSMDKYDAVVVGLGPGGASALYKLASEGLKVLGIDRRREIGVPIQCGEFIPQYHEYSKILPEVEEPYLEIFRKMPMKLVSNKTKSVSVITPSGKEYSVNFDGYVIDREAFDKWIVKEAVDRGADVMINTVVYKLGEDGTVYARGKSGNFEVLGETVVIAAGTSSTLLEQVGLFREVDEMNLGHVINYQMAGVDSDPSVVEMYTGKEYSPGAYAWIIPKGDGVANVGLGIRYPYVEGERDINIYMERFWRKHPIASMKLRRAQPLSYVGGLVPVGPPPDKTVSGRFLSVGDAANHNIASLGAGIVTSSIAGIAAGEAISKFLAGEVKLEYYEDLWRRLLGRALENGYKLRLVVDLITKDDKYTDMFMEIVGKDRIYDLVYTKAPSNVDLLRIALNIVKGGS